jgi:hypothetical protein
MDSLAATINEPMDEWSFYKKIVDVIAQTRTGHTTTWLSKDFPFRSLPLRRYFLDDRIYVNRDLSGNSAMPEGSEIMSINGLSSKTTIDTLLKHISGDGSNRTFRIRMQASKKLNH